MTPRVDLGGRAGAGCSADNFSRGIVIERAAARVCLDDSARERGRADRMTARESQCPGIAVAVQLFSGGSLRAALAKLASRCASKRARNLSFALPRYLDALPLSLQNIQGMPFSAHRSAHRGFRPRPLTTAPLRRHGHDEVGERSSPGHAPYPTHSDTKRCKRGR